MCWTYDPLRSANGHLNIHKLGASSRHYIANAYTATTSMRDAGVPIDRLWVEWDLTARHITRPTEVTDAVTVLRVEGQLPSEPDLFVDSPWITVQIPTDIDAVKAGGVEGVNAWRTATSAVFRSYFGRGYVVRDYVRGVGYVLSRVEGKR
jgi:predicted GNAT superfamily acetyltransferase